MKFEFSAGGIVLKKEQSEIFVLMAQHAQHHGWGFPKGHIGDKIEGESKEDTAVREVKEETGIDAEIIQPATEEKYWYQWGKEKRKKTVYYYFMKSLGGDFNNRDHEMETVEWVPVPQVEDKLTYQNAKEMFKKMKPEIEKIAVSL